MPVKTKTRQSHHVAHKHEKRTKHFLKVYAPYIPLLTILACGFMLSTNSEAQQFSGQVKSYATNTSDSGLLTETNKRRAEEGLKPLAFNVALDQAAQAKADDMKARNYWSHVTPDGQEPWSFIEKVNYSYSKAAENLAYGFDSSESTLNGWMNSPGHRANVMDPELSEVGFGLANVPDYQGHGPETIVVAMYAAPLVSSAARQEPAVKPQTTPTPTEPQKISYIQFLTSGAAPWSSFVAGLMFGGIITYLFVKHTRSLRRTLKRGERFVIHHPLFDATLVALLALIALVSQTIGHIY